MKRTLVIAIMINIVISGLSFAARPGGMTGAPPYPCDASESILNGINSYKHNPEKGTEGIVFYGDVSDPTTVDPYILESVTLTALVNKYNALPYDFEPKNLVRIITNTDLEGYMQKPAAKAYERMRIEAEKQGIIFSIVSTYRSRDYQNWSFSRRYAADAVHASGFTAHSRRSEHELGLALDFGIGHILSMDFAETETGRFLDENAHKYGFILRYTDTGRKSHQYGYEPWHYRYVGTYLATIIKERNITLEEYYGISD